MNIPAILLTNKQYGKPKPNSKKFYYRCIPNNIDLYNNTNYLVAFQPKLEFSKKKYNYYVIINNSLCSLSRIYLTEKHLDIIYLSAFSDVCIAYYCFYWRYFIQ